MSYDSTNADEVAGVEEARANGDTRWSKKVWPWILAILGISISIVLLSRCGGNSAASNDASSTSAVVTPVTSTAVIPAQPLAATSSLSLESGNRELVATVSLQTHGSLVSSIEFEVEGNGKWIDSGLIASGNFTISELENGTSYSVVVRVTSNGTGSPTISDSAVGTPAEHVTKATTTIPPADSKTKATTTTTTNATPTASLPSNTTTTAPPATIPPTTSTTIPQTGPATTTGPTSTTTTTTSTTTTTTTTEPLGN